MGEHAPGDRAKTRRRIRRGARPRSRAGRTDRGRGRVRAADRPADDRAGGVRAAHRLPRRGALLDRMAAEPADVHAPRTQLHPGIPGTDALRLRQPAVLGRGHRGQRFHRRAGLAARGPARAVRTRRLAAHPQLQRRDRGLGRRSVRHRGPLRDRAVLPRQPDRVRMAARRRPAHPAAPRRDRRASGHRPAVLVQPDRLPQRVDDGPRGARVPGRHLRGRRPSVQHALRQRRPDRRGRRAIAQRGVRGTHRRRTVAGGRPAAGRQRPHRAQPGRLRGPARGARRTGRPGAAFRLLARFRGENQ